MSATITAGPGADDLTAAIRRAAPITGTCLSAKQFHAPKILDRKGVPHGARAV